MSASDLIVRYVRQTGGMSMPDIVRAMQDHGEKEREIRQMVWRLVNEGCLIWDWDRKMRVRSGRDARTEES